MRSKILQEEYNDLRRRLDSLNIDQKSAYFDYIKSNYQSVNASYALAGDSDRQRILKDVREVSRQLWTAGNRPQAQALGVILLNIESEFMFDDDAAIVKARTDALIKEIHTKDIRHNK